MTLEGPIHTFSTDVFCEFPENGLNSDWTTACGEKELKFPPSHYAFWTWNE